MCKVFKRACNQKDALNSLTVHTDAVLYAWHVCQKLFVEKGILYQGSRSDKCCLKRVMISFW